MMPQIKFLNQIRKNRDKLAESAEPVDEPKGGKHRKLGGYGPDKSRSKSESWRLRAFVNHVAFVGSDRLIAWYLCDPQQWTFRSIAEGNALITDFASTLAELEGTTVHIRGTTRPYPVAAWGEAAWKNASEPQTGWERLMDRDQRHMASSAQVDKLVYIGVDLGQRGVVLSLLSKVSSGIVDREMVALQERLDRLDEVMAGPGAEARPATPSEIEWLLAKSFALGCPVPVPDPAEPTEAALSSDDIAGMVNSVDWSADPLAPAVKISASLGGRQVTRYVSVLTVGRVADIKIPEDHVPWMSKSDQMPFPVEWYCRVDVRTPEEISKEMTKQSNLVDGQLSHWGDDHGKRPPKQLSRQARRTGDVEDEMRTGFTGLSTRTKCWFRIAVSGNTEEEAVERAAAVIGHYKPQIRVVREMGQYALAREFVPGEPLSTTAHVRHWPILKVASGLPQITAEVGDKRGWHIGETAGIVRRAVCHDPWYLTEVMESSGLIPVVGTLGSGKTVLLGTCFYKGIQSGAYGVALDPAGRLQRLLRLDDMRGISASVDLLGGLPGSLAPYAVVPDPNPELVRMECDNPTDEDEYRQRMRRAKLAAEATRRDLCFQTLRWCLPPYIAANESAQAMLSTVIRKQPADATSIATSVILALENGDADMKELGQHLRTASERELGRLFFHEVNQDRDVQLVSSARATVFNLKGLMRPDPGTDINDWSADELLARPIMTLAAWASVNLIYRRSPHERKLFALDEAHEVTGQGGAGRALVTKIATDTRKNNTAAYLSTQNASTILGQDINNFTGAAFVGRTSDEAAQKAALRLLGKPEGVGYEALLGNLSRRRRSGEFLPYREFIYRDGLGGEGGRGGMEKVRVSISHHPELFDALNSTPGQQNRHERRQDETDVEGVA